MTDKRTYICLGPKDMAVALTALYALDPVRKWRITIEPYRKSRTTDQNNLMWAWYTEIAKHTGHTPDEINEWCKRMFLAPRHAKFGNSMEIKYWTTTKLNTAEMSEYLERIRAWAATDLNMTLSEER